MQIQPGDLGPDSQAAVVAKVDAALARFQHSTDPHVLELWSELCVHRAALRDGGTTRGSADAVHKGPPGPPLGTSALDGVEQDEHRQPQVLEQRLVERRRHWASVSPQVRHHEHTSSHLNMAHYIDDLTFARACACLFVQ